MTWRRREVLALGGSLLGLGGCSGLGWLGAPEEPPLPGERIPVMLLEQGLEADPAVTGLPVVLPPPVRNASWSQLGGNARHAMHHLALGEALRPAWRASIGSGSSDTSRLLAPPVVAEGRVFTVDTELVVRAFDLASGREQWSRRPEIIEDVDRLLAGGLAHAQGRLFLTATNGEIHALDATNGSALWRRALKVPIEAPATVARGRLFIVTSDNRTLALDAASGRPLWQHAGFFEQAGILGGAPAAVGGGIVVAPYSSGEVFALRFADGRPLWSGSVLRLRRTLALGRISDITAAPVIDDDRVYVAGNGGEVAAFRLDLGRRIWALDATVRETPWIAGRFLYLLTSRNELVCLLRERGAIRWVRRLAELVDPDNPASPHLLWSAPVLAGNRLLLAGSGAEAVSVSPQSGEILGRIELPGAVRLQPVVAEGTLLFLTEAGELLAYR